MNIQRALIAKETKKLRIQLTVFDDAAETLERLSVATGVKLQRLCEQLLNELLLHDPTIRKSITQTVGTQRSVKKTTSGSKELEAGKER